MTIEIFATMKGKTMKQIRMAIVGLFACLAFICMVLEPANQDTWFKDFFIIKTIAALFGYVAYRLAKYWESKGLLPEMDDDV